MPLFTDLKGQSVHLWYSLFNKISLYEFRSALFVQLLHYFGFTIQLVMLCVFNVKVKNFAFDTSKSITNARFSMKNYLKQLYVFCFYSNCFQK